MEIRTELMLGQCDYISKLEWVLVYRLDSFVGLQC